MKSMEGKQVRAAGGGISADWLKVTAMVTMLIDHTGVVLFPGDMGWRLIGRIAFPLYVWLLVEGFSHTSDLRRYILRMGAFALISEVPFDLAVSGTAVSWEWQNVYWTLVSGLLMLCVLDRIRGRGPVRWILTALAVLGFMIAAELLGFDYGCTGPFLVFVFYLYARCGYPHPAVGFVLFCAVNLLTPVLDGYPLSYPAVWLNAAYTAVLEGFGIFSVPLICMYNGVRRWKRGKYFFYLYYPAHLLLLYGISRL